MVDQKTMNGRADPAVLPPEHADGRGGDIRQQIVLLAELQAQLFQIDLRDGLRRLALSGVLLLGVLAVGLATLSVALIFIAELLVDVAGLSRSVAFLIATVIGVLSAAGLVVAAGLCLRASLHVFDRSREELGRTIEWIKRTLKRPVPADKDRDDRDGRRSFS